MSLLGALTEEEEIEMEQRKNFNNEAVDLK